MGSIGVSHGNLLYRTQCVKLYCFVIGFCLFAISSWKMFVGTRFRFLLRCHSDILDLTEQSIANFPKSQVFNSGLNLIDQRNEKKYDFSIQSEFRPLCRYASAVQCLVEMTVINCVFEFSDRHWAQANATVSVECNTSHCKEIIYVNFSSDVEESIVMIERLWILLFINREALEIWMMRVF